VLESSADVAQEGAEAMAATTDTRNTSEALAERLVAGTIGALELYSVYLGAELGLYRTLDDHGPLSPPDLAERAGIHPRYAREWLEQQAVAGLLEVDDFEVGPDSRRFELPKEHARVLAEPDDALHVAPLAHLVAGIGRVLSEVAEAYRTGAGVSYATYGREFRYGQGHINRPTFMGDLPTEWLSAMPGVVTRLERAPESRVADIGCGQGWGSLGIARAFPNARVDGFDLDRASIADARRHAAEAGLEGRVRFVEGDAAGVAREGPYDLVLILETLHDLPRPVDALRAARAALAEDGSVLVVDEKVSDRFTAPGDETERLMYGWSIVHCLPTQLTEQPSAAIGTVMRASTVRALAAEAGFAHVEVLPVETDFFRLYRLSG
jgi:SAM-dependent methyltransferase